MNDQVKFQLLDASLLTLGDQVGHVNA